MICKFAINVRRDSNKPTTSMQDQFIETIGEAEYQEKIKNHLLELNLEVRASDEKTATDEVFLLKDESILSLKAAGLSTENIIDGGHELWKPWYGQKKSGKFARYKIIIKSRSENMMRQIMNEALV